MRISDWSSDVCSSDLSQPAYVESPVPSPPSVRATSSNAAKTLSLPMKPSIGGSPAIEAAAMAAAVKTTGILWARPDSSRRSRVPVDLSMMPTERNRVALRSEEHTSELQSLMRISYAVFCLKKKKTHNKHRK